MHAMHHTGEIQQMQLTQGSQHYSVFKTPSQESSPEGLQHRT